MKRLLVSLTLALTLIAFAAAPALAIDASKSASVTVTEFISFTVTDVSSDGVQFGSLAPNTPDNPADGQDAVNGAVTLAVAAETNVDCDINLKGADFGDGAAHLIAIGNAGWHTSDVPGSATPMTTLYALVDTSSAGVAKSVDVWHWLSVPAGQYANTYNTNFDYQAVKQP